MALSAPLQTDIAIDYGRLFHSLSAAYIVFAADDPVFTIIEENEAHARAAMVEREAVIGKPLLEVFTDVSATYKKTGKSVLLESIRKVIRTNKPDTIPRLRYDIKNPEGAYETHYWNVSHHPLTDNKGKIVAVYQATHNITQAVSTEEQLARAQSRLNQTLANSAIGTWLWDIPDGMIYMDKNFAHLFGVDPQEAAAGLKSATMMASLHPDDRRRVSDETQRALKEKGTFESEYRTIDNTGEVHWIIARGHVELNAAGEPIRFPGVVIDITDRKTAENNLNYLAQASTQFSASLDYRDTLNNIASIVVPHIADWCSIELLDATDQLEQAAVAHRDPKKVAWSKELRAKQGPPDLNDPTSGVAQVLKTGEALLIPTITDEMLVTAAKSKSELKLLRSLGMCSIIVAPMKIDGKTIGAISLISTESRVHYKPIDLEFAVGFANRAALAVYNATLYQQAQQELEEREWLQEQLETANTILESSVKERTQQLVQTNEGLQKEILKRQQAESVLRSYSNDLARSNQELQDFAYVASHDLQEPLRKIQAFGDLLESEHGETLGEGMEYLTRMRGAASRMSVLIEDLLAFSRVSTRQRTIADVSLNTIVHDVVNDLETRIEETNGKIELQPLPKVKADPTHMRQLFQNLIGNALKFHRAGVPPLVKVYAAPTHSIDKMHTIYVEDNGIGFDEKYLDRIFAVFQRLRGKESYDGTGIGLAVCRKIVEQYNGTITATSKKGKGSTFIIKLPKKRRNIREQS